MASSPGEDARSVRASATKKRKEMDPMMAQDGLASGQEREIGPEASMRAMYRSTSSSYAAIYGHKRTFCPSPGFVSSDRTFLGPKIDTAPQHTRESSPESGISAYKRTLTPKQVPALQRVQSSFSSLPLSSTESLKMRKVVPAERMPLSHADLGSLDKSLAIPTEDAASQSTLFSSPRLTSVYNGTLTLGDGQALKRTPSTFSSEPLHPNILSLENIAALARASSSYEQPPSENTTMQKAGMAPERKPLPSSRLSSSTASLTASDIDEASSDSPKIVVDSLPPFNPDGKPYLCLYKYAGCNHAANDASAIKRHISTVHIAPFIWECLEPKCQQAYPYSEKRFRNHHRDAYLKHLQGQKHDDIRGDHDRSGPWALGMAEAAKRPGRPQPESLTCPIPKCGMIFRITGVHEHLALVVHIYKDTEHMNQIAFAANNPHPSWIEYSLRTGITKYDDNSKVTCVPVESDEVNCLAEERRAELDQCERCHSQGPTMPCTRSSVRADKCCMWCKNAGEECSHVTRCDDCTLAERPCTHNVHRADGDVHVHQHAAAEEQYAGANLAAVGDEDNPQNEDEHDQQHAAAEEQHTEANLAAIEDENNPQNEDEHDRQHAAAEEQHEEANLAAVGDENEPQD